MLIDAGELTLAAPLYRGHDIFRLLGALGIGVIIFVVLVVVFAVWLTSQKGGPFKGGWRNRGPMG